MKITISRWIWPVLLALPLAACGSLGRLPSNFALFDLGLTSPVSVPPALVPAQLEVRAPSWLDNSAMQYRLAYRDPTRRHAYSESRWVAEPDEMLAVALDRALRRGTTEGQCRLRLQLDEFVQVFDKADSARAEIRVRAALLPRRGDHALAETDLSIDAPAPTADAGGGVRAHREALRRLAVALGAWLTGLDRDGGEGLNTAARCGS